MGFKVQISRIRNHLDIWMNPSLHRSSENIHVHGASGPRLRSTWCVSQMGSAGVSAPSSFDLEGAARFQKSCLILKETTTSASWSLWGITLMKKPSLLDFLKATMLKERERRVKNVPVLTWFRPPCWLTLGRPGSPEVQPAHHTRQQHLFLPTSVPYWVQ